MDALNKNEIRKSYLIFIFYFSVLLIISVICWKLFLETEKSFVSILKEKQEEIIKHTTTQSLLNSNIDSINYYLAITNTGAVKNEAALERKIIQLKDESLSEINKAASESMYTYPLQKKILLDIEENLEEKRELQKNKEEENNYKVKLQECSSANQKLRNRK